MIREPKPATLAKYGLSIAEWKAMVDKQGGRCPVCEKPLELAAIDHVHAPKWKKKPPGERKKYVRGVVCFSCNHRLLGRFVTLAKAKNVVKFLEAYARRAG